MVQDSSCPLPPGLTAEADMPHASDVGDPGEGGAIYASVAGEVRAVAVEAMEEKLAQLGCASGQHSVAEAIRESVMKEVEVRVQERTDELWIKGKQMLGQLQLKHKERTNQLTEQVQQCQRNCQALEEENAHLKQALSGLATKFALLGAVLSGTEASLPRETIEASSSVAQLARVPTSPGTGSPEVSESAEVTADLLTSKVPQVPEFPVSAGSSIAPPPQSPNGAATLSLAEALGGSQMPVRTPLSLVNSLSPTRQPEALKVFSMTLRKADAADLGLNVSHHETDKVLKVEGIRPGGAVEAWNRQCAGGAARDKAIFVGDKIISVNSVTYDPQEMLKECKDKLLLKLTLVRGDRLPMPPSTSQMPSKAQPAKPKAGGGSGTSLRADASVFVPMSGSGGETPSAGQTRKAEASTPDSGSGNASANATDRV